MRGFPQKTFLLRMHNKRDHNYRNRIHQNFFFYEHMTTADLESLSGRMLRTVYRWMEDAKGGETRQKAGQQDRGINSPGVISATIIIIIIIFITSMAKHQPIRTESIH